MLKGSDNNKNYVGSFVRRLDSYAANLSQRECLFQAAVMMRSMDPLGRVTLRDPSSLLEPYEAGSFPIKLEKDPE